MCGNPVPAQYLSSGCYCAYTQSSTTKIESAYTWIYSSNLPSTLICLFALSVTGWTGSSSAAAVSLPTLSPTGWRSFAQDGVAAETFEWSPFCYLLPHSITKCTPRANIFTFWVETPILRAWQLLPGQPEESALLWKVLWRHMCCWYLGEGTLGTACD